MKIITKSSSETKKIGKKIGAKLKAGDVVALFGELGAGKTTLVGGIVEGLGGNAQDVSSPTFSLVNEYKGRHKIFHMDWYRLKKLKGSDAAMIQEYFSKEHIVLIEWPERGKDLLPKKHMEIFLEHQNENQRRLSVTTA